MTVYEMTIKIFILRDIPISGIYTELARYIDSYLVKDDFYQEFHNRNLIKGYCFDLPVKIEKGMKSYKRDQIYQFRIRTVNQELLSYLMNGLADHKTDAIKGLTRIVRQIPDKPIASVHALTPIVLKNADNKGYWRDCMSFEEFEKELCAGLIHQYEIYTGELIERDLTLYDQIELQSKCAIGVPYKGITLLGDKVSMRVSDNESAQKVLRFALANSMGTMGSRGCGFLGYRFV